MKKEPQGSPSGEEYNIFSDLANDLPTAEPNLFGWAEPMETEHINSELAIILRLARVKRTQTAPGVLSITTAAAGGSLWQTLEEFAKRHAPQIKNALSNARPDTVDAVLMDFAGILNGHHFLAATVEQMRDALANCSKLRAYGVEKYAFFVGVLLGYDRYLTIWEDCKKHYIENTNPAQKAYYLRLVQESRGDLPALTWQNIIFREEESFKQASADVPADTVDAFRKWANTFGNDGYFNLYVNLCREALNATPQQIKEIFDANGLTVTANDLTAADLFGDEMRVYLERIAEQVAAVAEAQTDAQRRESAEELRTVIKNMPLAVVGSRSIYGNVTGNIAPIHTIGALIRDYMHDNPNSLTTADYVEKALEGVGLILAGSLATPQPGQNGLEYKIAVTTSNFAEMCGLKDANEKQLLQLFSALGVLNDIYLCVWKPGGHIAQKLLTVERMEFKTGQKLPEQIKMTFYTSAFTDRTKIRIITPELSQRLQAESKRGTARRHFANQIITKGHKREEALLDEVFNYTARIDDARANTTNEAEITKVRDDIRKHKSRDRRKLAQFFEEYQRDGLITYTYANGVYSWVCLNADGQAGEPGADTLPDGQKGE